MWALSTWSETRLPQARSQVLNFSCKCALTQQPQLFFPAIYKYMILWILKECRSYKWEEIQNICLSGLAYIIITARAHFSANDVTSFLSVAEKSPVSAYYVHPTFYLLCASHILPTVRILHFTYCVFHILSTMCIPHFIKSSLLGHLVFIFILVLFVGAHVSWCECGVRG